MRSSIRRGLIVVFAILAVVIVVAVAAMVVLQTPWGGRQLARLAEQQAERAIDADVSIGSIDGHLMSAPVIHDLSITQHGRPVLQAERVEAGYEAARVLGGDLAIDEITLVDPTITLVEEGGGITLFNLFRTDRHAANTAPRPFALNRVRIENGRVILGPKVRKLTGVDVPDTLSDVDGRVRLVRDENGLRTEIQHLSFTATEPALTVEELAGEIRYANGTVTIGHIDLRTAESALSIDGSIDRSPQGS